MIKDIKTKRYYTAINGIQNLLRLKKENETVIDWVIRDIRNLFDHDKEDYYKPVRAGNFWRNNCIECNVMVIEIKNYYQLRDTLIKLDLINDLKKIWYMESPITNSK